MKSRLLAVLFVVVAMFGMLSAVSAQDMDPCLGLSAADCDILKAADAKLEEMVSFTQSFTFNLTLGGLDSLGMMMGGMGSGEPSGPVVISASASNSPFVTFPDATDPLKSFALAIDISGSVSGTGTDDTSGSQSFMIVDGNAYVQDPASGQWIGFSLLDLIESGALESAGLPLDPTALLEGDMGAMGAATDPAAALAEAGLSPDQIAGLMNVSGFLSQARVADAEANGQRMYAFESKIDFVPLFSSSEFQNMLMGLASAAGESDLAEVGELAMLLPMLISEGDIQLTRWIGADDMFVHRLVLGINVKVDLGMLMGGMGGSDMPEIEPITLRMSLDVQLSNHNATAAPTAPADAQIIPAEQLMGSGF